MRNGGIRLVLGFVVESLDELCFVDLVSFVNGLITGYVHQTRLQFARIPIMTGHGPFDQSVPTLQVALSLLLVPNILFKSVVGLPTVEFDLDAVECVEEVFGHVLSGDYDAAPVNGLSCLFDGAGLIFPAVVRPHIELRAGKHALLLLPVSICLFVSRPLSFNSLVLFDA